MWKLFPNPVEFVLNGNLTNRWIIQQTENQMYLLVFTSDTDFFSILLNFVYFFMLMDPFFESNSDKMIPTF